MSLAEPAELNQVAPMHYEALHLLHYERQVELGKVVTLHTDPSTGDIDSVPQLSSDLTDVIEDTARAITAAAMHTHRSVLELAPDPTKTLLNVASTTVNMEATVGELNRSDNAVPLRAAYDSVVLKRASRMLAEKADGTILRCASADAIFPLLAALDPHKLYKARISKPKDAVKTIELHGYSKPELRLAYDAALLATALRHKSPADAVAIIESFGANQASKRSMRRVLDGTLTTILPQLDWPLAQQAVQNAYSPEARAALAASYGERLSDAALRAPSPEEALNMARKFSLGGSTVLETKLAIAWLPGVKKMLEVLKAQHDDMRGRKRPTTTRLVQAWTHRNKQALYERRLAELTAIMERG